MAEAIEEQREVITNAVEEALEDVALTRAIEEGLNTPEISRVKVMRALGRKK